MLHGELEWEDLDIFFEEFAVDAVIYFPVTDEIYDIKGIFETPYLKRDFGGFIVDADAPSFTCKWQDIFVGVRKGDVLFPNETIASIREIEGVYEEITGEKAFYIDSAPQNDGTGVVSFILTKATTQDEEGDELDDTIDETPTGGGLFGSNPAEE